MALVFTVAVRVLKSVVSTFKAKAVFASEIFNFSVKVVFVVFNAERSAFAESAVSTSVWFAFCVSVVLVAWSDDRSAFVAIFVMKTLVSSFYPRRY